ncbi:MAG: (d)CMP kinase [Pseudomonadota bacterium]
MKFTVAIDGPAAAGKGTIAKAVAAHFGFAHLDTGLLYRAVGKKALDAGVEGNGVVQIARDLVPDDLDAENLRTVEVAQAASKVAVIPEVRAVLRDFQKSFARGDGGAVLDGRDIGTVICPDAEVKLFVTASPEIRAERRYLELSAKGEEVSRDEILAAVLKRDAVDASRADSPMIEAEDAVRIETSEMDIETAVEAVIALIQSRMAPVQKLT